MKTLPLILSTVTLKTVYWRRKMNKAREKSRKKKSLLQIRDKESRNMKSKILPRNFIAINPKLLSCQVLKKRKTLTQTRN